MAVVCVFLPRVFDVEYFLLVSLFVRRTIECCISYGAVPLLPDSVRQSYSTGFLVFRLPGALIAMLFLFLMLLID